MPDLPLAIDIADTVAEAARARQRLDVEVVAQELLSAHPEADACQSAVAEALKELAGESKVIVCRPHNGPPEARWPDH